MRDENILAKISATLHKENRRKPVTMGLVICDVNHQHRTMKEQTHDRRKNG